MANHTKPTPEELKQQQADIIAEAEKLKEVHNPDAEEEEPTPPVDTTPEAEPSEPAPPAEEEKSDAPEEEPEPSKPAKEEKKEEEQGDPSKELYKNKFKASSRESQKLSASARVMNQTMDEANDLPEPTEDELKQKYPEWEVMSDIERGFAKDAVVNERFRAKINEGRQKAKKIEKWQEDVTKFVDDPVTLVDNPELEGKREAFMQYATDEKNNNVPFDTLVPAFLHIWQAEENKEKASKDRRRMFPSGQGGPNTPPKNTNPNNKKLTLEEAKALKNTDYKKYVQYVKEKRIEFNI